MHLLESPGIADSDKRCMGARGMELGKDLIVPRNRWGLKHSPHVAAGTVPGGEENA